MIRTSFTSTPALTCAKPDSAAMLWPSTAENSARFLPFLHHPFKGRETEEQSFVLFDHVRKYLRKLHHGRLAGVFQIGPYSTFCVPPVTGVIPVLDPPTPLCRGIPTSKTSFTKKIRFPIRKLGSLARMAPVTRPSIIGNRVTDFRRCDHCSPQTRWRRQPAADCDRSG
jgi:hypothetical protein